jgi:hypothetical protein
MPGVRIAWLGGWRKVMSSTDARGQRAGGPGLGRLPFRTPPIEGLLDRMLADGRMALVTENFELDVVAMQPHGSPAGRRHPER